MKSPKPTVASADRQTLATQRLATLKLLVEERLRSGTLAEVLHESLARQVELEMERIRGLIKSGLKVTANYKEGHSETEGDSVEFEIAITPNDSKIKGVG